MCASRDSSSFAVRARQAIASLGDRVRAQPTASRSGSRHATGGSRWRGSGLAGVVSSIDPVCGAVGDLHDRAPACVRDDAGQAGDIVLLRSSSIES
jgi:hypothetical protein